MNRGWGRSPRVNLTAIAAEIAARKQARRDEYDAAIRLAQLMCPSTEARLIAAMLCDAGVLERTEDVDLSYFSDFRYQAILTSIRELQVTDSPIGVLEVADDIALSDLARDKHVADTVNVCFLGILILDKSPYWGCEMTLNHDLHWLRKLAARREAA